MSMVLTHKWQEQGLGEAPFDAICIISLPSAESFGTNFAGYQNAMMEATSQARHFGVSLGSCDSCGQSLTNNVVIRDRNRKYFVVGCDCAGKTHDAKLISRVEYLDKQRQKVNREAKRQAKWEARRVALNAELQAQRDRNGGLTDAEVEAKRRESEEEARRQQFATENAWLLDVLARIPYESGFVSSIMADLQTRSVSSLSDRCLGILAEIYAKTVSGSRKGSKAYKAVEEEFWSKVRK